MGVEEYEPRVIQQFLELSYRYVIDVLSDAQIYSDHASKSSIDVDDVKLAIQSRVNSTFSQPPPREILMELARSRNKLPLPKSIQTGGMPLPPEQHTLTHPNYQLLIPKQHWAGSEVDVEIEEEDVVDADTSENQNPSQSPVTNVTSPTSQEQVQEEQQLQQQRVAFSMTAGKRPRNS
ncbi:Transcription initiation factor TFIID subunit [Zostera marina]|uniref:Transcription initiation factor TFIID subunit n=1 Tax=Zostera marina TaxID=29655 RepID=A0A0K9NTU7_ZOSMR|nr:Transcription initiation factor TFIID subunit [Zostera marina]